MFFFASGLCSVRGLVCLTPQRWKQGLEEEKGESSAIKIWKQKSRGSWWYNQGGGGGWGGRDSQGDS